MRKYLHGGDEVNFKELREKSGQTVEKIAEKFNVKESTYKKYEYSVRLPNASILSQMHIAYQCSADEVMEAYSYHKGVQIKRYGRTNP